MKRTLQAIFKCSVARIRNHVDRIFLDGRYTVFKDEFSTRFWKRGGQSATCTRRFFLRHQAPSRGFRSTPNLSLEQAFVVLPDTAGLQTTSWKPSL